MIGIVVSVLKDYDSSMFWSSTFNIFTECHIYSLAWKKLWCCLHLFKTDQYELPRWNISVVALASCKGILSHIWLVHLWEAPAHTSCNLSRSWKALSFMKWGCATVREATAAAALCYCCGGIYLGASVTHKRDAAAESSLLWEQEQLLGASCVPLYVIGINCGYCLEPYFHIFSSTLSTEDKNNQCSL